MFLNEEKATKWFESILWKEGRACRHCKSDRTVIYNSKGSMPYRCKDCRLPFSVKTNTILHSSKVPLQKWIIAIYLMATNLKGVSSMKLSRDLKITQKTAWILLQKIRQGFTDENLEKLKGFIEVDETYIGGKAENMSMKKRVEAKGKLKKECMLGMKQRDGRVVLNHVENSKTRYLN